MKFGILAAFLHASLIGKIIWLLLIAVSIFALALFLKKKKAFKISKQEDEHINNALKAAEYNPEEKILTPSCSQGAFYLTIESWQHCMKSKNSYQSTEALLNSASMETLHQYEKHLPYLASIASNSPFVGLLGTVIGIIHAFQVIGSTGNTSLQTLGPALAEALYATAIGLAVAITATVFYNFLINEIKDFEVKLESLKSQLLISSFDEGQKPLNSDKD